MGLDLFACGYYRINWFNKNGETVKTYEKYLTYQKYRREIMNMQTAFLQGADVDGLKITPLEKGAD